MVMVINLRGTSASLLMAWRTNSLRGVCKIKRLFFGNKERHVVKQAFRNLKCCNISMQKLQFCDGIKDFIYFARYKSVKFIMYQMSLIIK